MNPLSTREREVAALVANGKKNREIGAALGITTSTASVHVFNACRKTCSVNRAALAEWVKLAKPE